MHYPIAGYRHGHNQFSQIVQLQLTMVIMVSQFGRGKQANTTL